MLHQMQKIARSTKNMAIKVWIVHWMRAVLEGVLGFSAAS
jgi:hypothetical protein